MAKNKKTHKILFIKNNGLDMKEISLSTIIASFSFLFILVFSFVIISIFSTDIMMLIDSASEYYSQDLKEAEEKIYEDVLTDMKKDNAILEEEIVEQAVRIEKLLIELDQIKERDESLRELLRLPSIDDDIRKLSTGGGVEKDQSYNEFNYLLPNELDIFYLNEQLKFISRTLRLEHLSYSEIEDELTPENLNYYLSFPAIYPVSLEKTYLSSTYGPRKDPYTQTMKFHDGDDFAGQSGVSVFSTADGVVKTSQRYGSFGNYIEIDHGNGYSTIYAHLKNRDVKKGDKVYRGQQIGSIGSTGRSTAPHLHYEVLYKNKHQDPHRFYFIPSIES